MTEEPYVKAMRADGKYTAVPKSQYEAMKQFNYADEIHHTDHYTWKGVECKAREIFKAYGFGQARFTDKEELIMTNYEAIKTMDKDELAEFLSSIMDGQKCPASKKFCDGQRCCADAILNWLNADLNDEPGETSDMIHHPDPYTWKGTECKKVIELMTRGLSGAEAYYMGNIIKYLYRYPKKGTLLSDLSKAVEYTESLRELFVKKEESGHAE